MNREYKINELIKLINLIEGVNLKPDYFKEKSNEYLDKEIEFYTYLLDK